MKPSTEQVLQWAREAAKDHPDFDPDNPAPSGDELAVFERYAALAYAAGAKAMQERAAMIAEGWECESAGGVYLTCGNGNFWDEGTIYDQGRADAAGAIRALGDDE